MEKSNKKYQVKNVADSYAIMDASQKVLVVCTPYFTTSTAS